MRVAWVTHQLPSVEGAENAENLLPGKFPGGAERSNHNRIQARPYGVEVTLIHSDNYRQAVDYDFVIVGATDRLSADAKETLSRTKHAMAITHPLPPSEGNALLFESAEIVIGYTPAHLEASVHDYTLKRSAWVPTPVDLDLITSAEKEEFALHAARRDWWKGADSAIEWAEANSIPLVVMQREPHQVVLETMSRAKYFVHLPKILDAEPSAVTEAVLSGCEIVYNENVGLTSVPDWSDPDALRKRIETAGRDFWELALN
jgi:hypothetical protein